MKKDPKLSIAEEIMLEFAGLTGLSPARDDPRRYLWTDAFAVCNFLELYRRTGTEKYRNLAVELVNQVHNILGRHRKDDPRSGWISGLDELEGKAHPTKGGLRIGKKLNERGPGDRFDDRLEWDRDGQYYHYLTKWMHALARVSAVTGDSTYSGWAIELARTAHARFTYVPFPGGQKRMYWKMRIDLSSPLVPSMGHHDPLDGFITYSEIQASSRQFSKGALELAGEIADMARICKGKDWTTDDALGIGGLLSDAYRVAQMMSAGTFGERDLLKNLLDASRVGLDTYARTNSLRGPADYRLAFRELGLSIGLHALERLQGLIEANQDILDKKRLLLTQIAGMREYLKLIDIIEKFWLEPANREAASWTEHRDINMVMLATSLIPDGFLTLF